jgi:hypothetical protein
MFVETTGYLSKEYLLSTLNYLFYHTEPIQPIIYYNGAVEENKTFMACSLRLITAADVAYPATPTATAADGCTEHPYSERLLKTFVWLKLLNSAIETCTL